MEGQNFVQPTLDEENEEKCPLAVYFGYSENPEEISVISKTEEQVKDSEPEPVKLFNLEQLQQQCPDFLILTWKTIPF